MTLAQSDLSRGEALLRAIALLEKLAASASGAGVQYARDIAVEWEARLRSAAEVAPGYLLPADTVTAVSELMGFVELVGPQDALEWIDLLPRNVLELAEPETVSLALDAKPTAQGLANLLIGAGGWAPKPTAAVCRALGVAA